MKPLEVWTCQRAENLKKKSSKIPQNNYAATLVSAARRQIIGGGGAHKLSAAAARRGRRTALLYGIDTNKVNRLQILVALTSHVDGDTKVFGVSFPSLLMSQVKL